MLVIVVGSPVTVISIVDEITEVAVITIVPEDPIVLVRYNVTVKKFVKVPCVKTVQAVFGV
jgi:hypothetical protein